VAEPTEPQRPPDTDPAVPPDVDEPGVRRRRRVRHRNRTELEPPDLEHFTAPEPAAPIAPDEPAPDDPPTPDAGAGGIVAEPDDPRPPARPTVPAAARARKPRPARPVAEADDWAGDARGGYPAEGPPTERGLRGLVGGGASQVSTAAAMRARDATRPRPEDLERAETQLAIVRRYWVPTNP
jgi:hypothetical protein